MLMAALAAALSPLEEGVRIRGDAAAPVVVVARESVGDDVADAPVVVVGRESVGDDVADAPVVVLIGKLAGDDVADNEDVEDEVKDTGEDGDGEEILLVKDRLGAIRLEASVGKLVTFGPHVCGDMASFDVIVKTGVSVETSPAKSSICI